MAECLCGEVARRDESRVARRLDRKPLGDGVYRLDAGALLEDCFHVLQAIGVMAQLEQVHGAAIPREMVPCIPSVRLDGLKTLLGMDSIEALPRVLCSDEALMPLVGFQAPQVRQGICQRGATTRQGERAPGPLCPATLAKTRVKWHVRDLEAGFKGAIRALATAGVLGAKVTGLAEGTALETTARDRGGGQVTRKRRLEDTWGRGYESAVTVSGWHVRLGIDAATTMPVAVTVGQIQAPEALWTRAWVIQARAQLAGAARQHKVVFATAVLAGPALWWLAPQDIIVVVPAKAQMAVTAEARAPAAAGKELTRGRRGPTGRHGPGRAAWTARLETAVVGITTLTTSEQSGTPGQGRHHHRGAFQAHPIHVVVVRQWPERDDGPGGNTVFLTKAAGRQPLKPCDDDADRRRIEHCCRTAAKPPWALGHPPQQTERAGRVPGVFTRLRCALATASRRPCARAALGGEPVGWQRRRRQLLEPTRDQVIVCAQGSYGIVHLAEDSLVWGAKLNDVPPRDRDTPASSGHIWTSMGEPSLMLEPQSAALTCLLIPDCQGEHPAESSELPILRRRVCWSSRLGRLLQPQRDI